MGISIHMLLNFLDEENKLLFQLVSTIVIFFSIHILIGILQVNFNKVNKANKYLNIKKLATMFFSPP